jgi:hypothetical protein
MLYMPQYRMALHAIVSDQNCGLFCPSTRSGPSFKR